ATGTGCAARAPRQGADGQGRFHDAPQALFGRFWERTGRAVVRADVFSATAARMSAFNAFSLILSPSWISMARLVLPSRLELKRRDGSLSKAPLAKVSFTTALYVSPVQMMPSCSHTGTPRIAFDGFLHFTS